MFTVLVWWSRWGWSNGENCTVMLMHAALNPMMPAQRRSKFVLKVDWKHCKDRNYILNRINLKYTVKSVSTDGECNNCTVACVPSCTLLSSASRFWKTTNDSLVKFLHVWFAHLNNQKRRVKWRICQMNWHRNASYCISRVAVPVVVIVSHTLISPLDFGFCT